MTNAVAAAGADSTDVITTSEVGDSVETSPTPETVSTLVYSTQSGKASPAHETPATLDELMIETREKVRRTFSGFLGPVVEAGVPFAATYGNHDFQCGILADEQDDIYREYPGCLNPDDSLEPGTFALPVESSDGSGRVAMSVMMVNSGDYAGKPEENDAQYPAYVVNPRGLDLADADGYGTPDPQGHRMAGVRPNRVGRAQWRRQARAGHRLPAHSAAGILRLSEGSARMDAERRGRRAHARRALLCAQP